MWAVRLTLHMSKSHCERPVSMNTVPNFGIIFSVGIYWPDCKREGPLFSAEFVCLSVCVCVSLTGTSTLHH